MLLICKPLVVYPFNCMVLYHSQTQRHVVEVFYEGCSNMNASSFITFVTYMLRQNGIHFYKGLYATFKLAADLEKIQYTYRIIAL